MENATENREKLASSLQLTGGVFSHATSTSLRKICSSLTKLLENRYEYFHITNRNHQHAHEFYSLVISQDYLELVERHIEKTNVEKLDFEDLNLVIGGRFPGTEFQKEVFLSKLKNIASDVKKGNSFVFEKLRR